MSELVSGSNFIQRIAAAWLDAAEFADNKANDARPDKDECVYWEHRADRYEAQAHLCLGVPPTGIAPALA